MIIIDFTTGDSTAVVLQSSRESVLESTTINHKDMVVVFSHPIPRVEENLAHAWINSQDFARLYTQETNEDETVELTLVGIVPNETIELLQELPNGAVGCLLKVAGEQYRITGYPWGEIVGFKNKVEQWNVVVEPGVKTLQLFSLPKERE